MLEPSEHHRDERMVADGPIPTTFSHASIDGGNEAEICFLQVAGVEEVEPTIALPHL